MLTMLRLVRSLLFWFPRESDLLCFVCVDCPIAKMLHKELAIQDGLVSIMKDPAGAAFAVYYRSDDWLEVRDYSSPGK